MQGTHSQPSWVRILVLLIAAAVFAVGSGTLAVASAANSSPTADCRLAYAPDQNPELSPASWAPWWLIGLGALALATVAFAAHRARVRGFVNRNRELARLLAARADEVKQRDRELASLYRADEELSRYLRLDQILQSLVDTAVDILKADKGALMMWDDQREKLTLRLHHGFHPEMVARVSLHPGEGVAGRVAVSGEPTIVTDTTIDPRVTLSIVEPEKIRSFMQVPITAGGEILGVFSADSLRPNAFGKADLHLLVTLAERAARAIENAQRYERVQETVVAEERSRLARELHDAVTQTLFSAGLIADVLPRVWAQDPTKGQQQLEEVRLLTRGALAEMRTLLLELRPEALINAQMEDLLGQLGRALTGRTGVPVALDIGGQIALPAAVQVAFYRIAQEALNNIARHAEATQVEVQYRSEPSRARLVIRDDGRGFEMDKVTQGHFGLQNMRERAAAIGAGLEIVSQPGTGTEIAMEWQEEAEDARRETDSRPDR